jgi:hypothetical protein
MRAVRRWAQHLGYRLQVHGLEISEPLARVAREAYPLWADRIHVGDVRRWKPPQRYDFVRIELLYASPSERPAMLRRCLEELTSGAGRVVVCSYRSQAAVARATVRASAARVGLPRLWPERGAR